VNRTGGRDCTGEHWGASHVLSANGLAVTGLLSCSILYYLSLWMFFRSVIKRRLSDIYTCTLRRVYTQYDPVLIVYVYHSILQAPRLARSMKSCHQRRHRSRWRWLRPLVAWMNWKNNMHQFQLVLAGTGSPPIFCSLSRVPHSQDIDMKENLWNRPWKSATQKKIFEIDRETPGFRGKRPAPFKPLFSTLSQRCILWYRSP
jgi:hypothetical protein